MLKTPPPEVAEIGPIPLDRPLFWFFHPYLQLVISILLSAAAQVLLKLGIDHSHGESWLGLSGLGSGWVWLGILAMVGSLLSWLQALRYIALNVAFNLTGIIHVLVPLGSWVILGERVSLQRWFGIGLVIAGVLTIAGPLMRAEEKL
jgi:multidrug transporter EmrE-like cation transporter